MTDINTGLIVRQTAERVDETTTGLDPILVINILTTVLPSLIGCIKRNDDVSSDQVQMRIVALHQKDPERLEKRIARSVRFEARKRHQRIDKEQSYAIANAIIDQAYVMQSSDVTGFCEALTGASTPYDEDDDL